ncbi:MAG: hypothetical protein ABIN91_23310 [Mucilaginibacter sp.]|uniref:DUF7009 family protein n=1 Tax=Mucilaginibacter sp. TaxID=1882438 RepID=UPI003264DB79
MKIRIGNNSLRYRLTRTEVERFASEGIAKETVQIGDEQLTYILERVLCDELAVSFKNNIIQLSVPEHLANEWTNTERVGFDNKDSSGLYLLVEKDFKCLDNVTEDQSDNYENPLANKK